MQTAIPLYDALVSANVSNEKAKAVVEAFAKEHDDMTSNFVTKADLAATKGELLAALAHLESRMTIKLGAMLVAAVGLTVAILKALH